MENGSFTRSVEDWLVELNNPNAQQRREVVITLADSETLDARLIKELKLIARGDPDLETQSLAKRALDVRGIEIYSQATNQPGVKSTNILGNSEFWIGFVLPPMLIFFISPVSLLLMANSILIILLLPVNIALLIYFGLTRKNVALGMLASFVFVILPICSMLYQTFRCFPDGCGG